jgi:N-acetylneuraminic acid mutarotase
MPTIRSNMTVGEINGVIYAVGGFENRSRFQSVNEAYDPAADAWTTKAPMPSKRETRGTNNAVVDGKLFVIGGNAEGRCSNLNEAYDPVTDSWMRRAPMPTPRCHLAVVALSGLIYAVGGTNTNGSIEYDTVEVYYPATDTWTTAAPMPSGRQDLGAVTLDGVLYALGGGNPALNSGGELNIVESYDPIMNTWTTRAPMQTPRSAMAVGVLNGMIIVVGGNTNEKASRAVEVYDPKRDSWTSLTTLPMPRSFLSGVTMNGTLYALGGNSPSETSGSAATNEAISLNPCPNQP